MADLTDFIQKQTIDIPAMERIKHRLFVVGRFNRRTVSPDVPPETYLFTNRPDSELNANYKELFTSVYGLRYESFIKALQPAIAEVIEWEQGSKIPKVIQHMPSYDGSKEGSVVIDMWNFFFWRAIANSDQEAFKGDLSGPARDILRKEESDPGRGIYKLIRRDLNLLCTFQPRTVQLAEAFSSTLGSTGKLNGLPAYASGDPLPGGFLEKLVDFVYSPELRDFSLDGIDLNDPVWDKLRKDDKVQKNFIRVVNNFRNALVGGTDQAPELRNNKGLTIFQASKELLGKREGLVNEFRQARDSYNALTQIVRSKVLLSMVLDWVFKAHYDLEPVKAIEDDDSGKDEMVSRLILGEVADAGVAEPVKRATSAERDRFKKSLADGFETLLRAVIADDSEQELMDALPEELKAVAKSIRADEGRRGMLKRMAGLTGDPRPFIESQKTILLDVLVPVLFQAPMMSLYDLRTLFRREVQTAYLTAVTLDDKYQGIVRQLAEDFLPKFVGNIDKSTRTIKNSASMQGELLKVYIARIANKDMADRIIEAQEQISCAMTVMENTVVQPGESRGASHLAPVYDDKTAVAKRSMPGKRVIAAVGTLAVSKAETELEEAGQARETVLVAADSTNSAAMSAAASATLWSPGGADVGGGGGGSGATTAADSIQPAAGGSASVVASGENEDSLSDPVSDDVTAMVRSFMKSNPKRQKKDLLEAIRVSAEADQKLVGKARDSVRIFSQILNVIYQRYRENQDKKSYMGRVERMTLANLMLSNQEALGLGGATSNLYSLLLDVVENMDPEVPDARAFIREFSLTRYFDNDDLEKKPHKKLGITELRETLTAQTVESLRNTVSFISELRGIKYLLDIVSKDNRAEVVVVNATADEFLDWMVRDNLTGGQTAKQLLHSGFIIGAQRENACPGLIYMTDSAFSTGGKGAWLDDLRKVKLMEGQQRLIIPPICISTTGQNETDAWIGEGQNLARSAAGGGPGQNSMPAAVLVVGPSPYMNRPGDPFATYLPAGYVFAAHYLCQPEQRVNNRMLKAKDEGRFRIIGGGHGPIRGSLERVMWGGDANDGYSFAADFYLYILLSVLATAQNNIQPNVARPAAKDFFPYFTYAKNIAQMNRWESSCVLNTALIGNSKQFGLEQVEPGKPHGSMLHLTANGELKIPDIRWFNEVLNRADLPRYSMTNPSNGAGV